MIVWLNFSWYIGVELLSCFMIKMLDTINKEQSFKNKVEAAWLQYEMGMFITNEDLKKKYDLKKL